MTNYKNQYVQKRDQIRSQMKQTTNPEMKKNLKIQLQDSEVEEAEARAKAKREKRDQLKKEIVEQFYSLTSNMVKVYRRLGIIRSDRQINERFNKSSNYIKSSMYQGHFPSSNLITDIIDDLDVIIRNIDKLMNDDFFNKQSVVNILTNLQNRFKELKLQIIRDLFI